MQRHFWRTVLLSLVVGAAPAAADQVAPPPIVAPPPPPTHLYIEAFGNWGLNLGRTPYVPDGEPGTSKHPFATGFGGGAQVGFTIVPGLSAFIDYRYGHTSTRKGSINGVLTEAQGSLNFHEITAGLRIERPTGAGNFYAHFGVGLIVPFHTTEEIEYAPQVAAIGLTGTGTTIENYKLGVGAQAELGYHWDLGTRFYLGPGLRVAAFQSDNAGKNTEITNFVTDFTAVPPRPVTTTIHHGTNGPVTPNTYSVQDVRINVSLGYRF